VISLGGNETAHVFFIIITIIYICFAVRDQLSKGRCRVVLHIIQMDIVLQFGLEINLITTLVDLQVG